MKRRIDDTEDELEVIKKKGISIKVIDNTIVKMQKERNISNNSTVKPVRLPGYRNGPMVHSAKGKSSSDISINADSNVIRNPHDLFLGTKRPIISQKRKSFHYCENNMPEKSITQNFMEETIGLKTIISENETDRDGDPTVENSVSAFTSPDRETFCKLQKVHGSSNDIGSGRESPFANEKMVETKKVGSKRSSLLNVPHGVSENDAKDIKKFLKGVGVHTKRAAGGNNDTRWENVSFGLRGLLKKMDDKIVGIKNNLGI